MALMTVSISPVIQTRKQLSARSLQCRKAQSSRPLLTKMTLVTTITLQFRNLKTLNFSGEHQKMLFISCGTATKSTFMRLITELRSIVRKIPKLNYRSVWKKVG